MKVKGWKCQNCGHETESQSNNLEELGFQQYSNFTSKISCKNCGTYTIQRAFDGTFTAGGLLVVRAKNKIKRKG